MKTLLFFSQGYGEFRYGTSIQKSLLKKMRFKKNINGTVQVRYVHNSILVDQNLRLDFMI